MNKGTSWNLYPEKGVISSSSLSCTSLTHQGVTRACQEAQLPRGCKFQDSHECRHDPCSMATQKQQGPERSCSLLTSSQAHTDWPPLHQVHIRLSPPCPTSGKVKRVHVLHRWLPPKLSNLHPRQTKAEGC